MNLFDFVDLIASTNLYCLTHRKISFIFHFFVCIVLGVVFVWLPYEFAIIVNTNPILALRIGNDLIFHHFYFRPVQLTVLQSVYHPHFTVVQRMIAYLPIVFYVLFLNNRGAKFIRSDRILLITHSDNILVVVGVIWVTIDAYNFARTHVVKFYKISYGIFFIFRILVIFQVLKESIDVFL